jgi:TetR/AcrR family transcriptional repressor of nem operon
MNASLNTRERLVETAAGLFARQGYHATGMAEILKAAEVHRGSLYHAFPAKRDLLVAVLERYLSGFEARVLLPAWEGVDDPIERVFALLARYRRFLEDTHCAFGCPIGSLALELHDADDGVRRLIAANFRAWSGHVERCLDAAGERLPADLDRPALARFVLVTMEGGVMLARTERDFPPFDEAVAMLRDYFDRLLA